MRRIALSCILLSLTMGCSDSKRSAAPVSPATASPGVGPTSSGTTTTVPTTVPIVPVTTLQPPRLTAPAPVHPNLSRGLRWTRTQAPFVSGLNVSLGPPSKADVDRYLDDFHATAAHLWQDGLPLEVDGWRAANRPDLRWLAWLLPDGGSQANGQFLGGYAPNTPGRIGYQISDEPRSLTELLALEQGLNRVRAADPNALLVVNFSFIAPDISAQLDHFVTSMDADVVSYDDYRLSKRAYQTLAQFRQVGLLAGKPYWRYLYAYVDSNQGIPNDSDMRWNAFAGLVYGYTGHTWFLYNASAAHGLDPVLFSSVGSLASPTPQFALAAQVNRELRTLGRSISQLTSTDVRYLAQISFLRPSRTQAWSRGAGNDPYLTDVSCRGADGLLGFFVDPRGDTYLMAQNVNHSGGSFPAGNTNRMTLTLSFDFSTAPGNVDRDSLQTLGRTTGQVTSLGLSPLGPNQRTLTIDLGAGNPMLLKYSTGNPFAYR